MTASIFVSASSGFTPCLIRAYSSIASLVSHWNMTGSGWPYISPYTKSFTTPTTVTREGPPLRNQHMVAIGQRHVLPEPPSVHHLHARRGQEPRRANGFFLTEEL